ncbi:DUF5013 domain-containing protein [Chitinophaga sp. GCM10012297]|uniref:DUF5013 domain-containing protein n=1 Tax=Chitinophaga chungangae TaxID=2821488 RepID=A0ABS3YJ87_9BACT|nr:DUF5013 domain-containing protein [Chitinophaga chungangae]MBO9154740.1 DUF5013 domain-containing protein [Chitinophaga chungangae]
MKNVFLLILATGLQALVSCSVDTLKDIRALEPKVSLVQTGAGTVSLKPEDMVVDKTNLLVRRTLGVSYAGFDPNETFTVTVQLEFNDLPEGYEPFAAGECFISGAADGKPLNGEIAVPAGAGNAPFYVNITKAAIDAHSGKKLAAKLKLTGVSKYRQNDMADSVFLLMDVNDFGSVKTDITAVYFKNSNFAPVAGATARFVNLADWTANVAVTSSRPTGAGFDANVGKFGIERWSLGDKSIINGKIFQSFSLPKGNYQIDVAMATVIPDRDTYLVVAAGADLPDDTQIGSAIASKLITAEFNKAVLSMTFANPADQQVSAGFLLNFDQGVQKVLQASNIRMYKIETLFD